MTPPLLTNAISFHLVNSGLIRMKLSVIFPETHRCRKKEGAWSWCNWGGCNSHMYSTPVNFQVVYCILEQFRPRRNFAVFYFLQTKGICCAFKHFLQALHSETNIVNRTVYFLFKAVKRCQKIDLSEEPRGQVVELRRQRLVRLQTGNIHCYKSFGGFGCI